MKSQLGQTASRTKSLKNVQILLQLSLLIRVIDNRIKSAFVAGEIQMLMGLNR